MADTQNFLNDFRRAQDPKKPRFEIYLVPGATPGDLQGTRPLAWRAIQGHSGKSKPDQESIGWRIIGNSEAPELWHGTTRAHLFSIAKSGIKPGGPPWRKT